MSAEPADAMELAATILEALYDGGTAFDVAQRFGVPIADVQELCRLAGHEMESHYDGDGVWAAYRGTWCVICGAPDGGNDD